MANDGSVRGKGRSKMRRYTRKQLRQYQADVASAENCRRSTVRGMRQPPPEHVRKNEGRRQVGRG